VAAWALAILTGRLADRPAVVLADDWDLADFADATDAADRADAVFASALRAAVLAAADLTLADLRVVVLATLDFLIPTAKPPRWIAHSRLPARKRGTFYFISPSF